jgi:tetratricopeptide (TPR) repeat protein
MERLTDSRFAGPGRLGLLLLLVLLSAVPAAAQSLWDDPAFRLTREAHDALERKDWATAARLSREAIAEYPDHVLAHYFLAQAALSQGQWDDAVRALQTVVRLYPKSFAGHRELGAALAQLGKTADSARAFETALALRPQGPDAQDVQMRLAFVRLQTGEKDKALPLLAGLAEANTPVPEVWTALGRIYYEGEKLTDSEKAFRRSAELRDDGRTWFNLAVVRLRLYDKPGAIQALERAARHPEVQTQAAAELRKLRSTDPAAPASAPAGPLPAPGATAPVQP